MDPTKDKKVYTDEERAELAEKLDQDLDSFIAGLERKAYTDGWPEDRWQEEMEKHPFFMTKFPEAGEEMSPLMEGLQQLKYDPLENTPEELATSYKEEGNFNFKCKKYRHAIINYTEGLKVKCSERDVNAQLYNNRAASNFLLKNYRSCLTDCQIALKLKPDYPKVKLRSAQCLFHIGKFSECIQLCDELLQENAADSTVIQLRTSCVNKQKESLRNERKRAQQEMKDEKDKAKVLQLIKQRNIILANTGKGDPLSFSQLEPNFPEITLQSVHADSNGRLIWPVLFLYPEYKITDFVQEFHEDVTFESMLEEMFSESPGWDEQGKYKPGKLSIYYQDKNEKPCQVAVTSTLGEVLSNSR